MRATNATSVAKEAARKGKPKTGAEAKITLVQSHSITTDPSRDALLTDFGKKTLDDRYLLPGETYQDMFARVASAFSDDAAHAQRIYDYISRLWFMPATPVLSNGGADRGLPISCFLNQVGEFARRHRRDLERERLARLQRRRHRHLLGRCPLDRREGRPERADLGHHPVHPRDGLADARDQPGLAAPRFGRLLSRHPPSGDRGVPRDPQSLRRLQPQEPEPASRHQHHRRVHGSGARRTRRSALRSPKTGEVLKSVDARKLWQKILELRMQTGEPYLLFTDTVNNAMPAHQRELGLKVTQSNLCSRNHAADRPSTIAASTARPSAASPRSTPRHSSSGRRAELHRGRRSASSTTCWKTSSSARRRKWHRAVYSAKRERSVGLGLMGFHSFLQAQDVALESPRPSRGTS